MSYLRKGTVIAIAVSLVIQSAAPAVAQGILDKSNLDKVTEREEASKAEEAVRTLFGILKPRPKENAQQKMYDLYVEGVQLERQGKFREALERYDAALKMDYTDPRVHMAVGRIVEPSDPALAMFHYQNAFRYAVEAAAEQVPAIEILRRFLVGRYLQYALPIQDPAVSTKLLEHAQAMAPEDPRIHAHLASAYFFQKQYQRSIQENKNAIALGLAEGVIFTNLAAAYAQLGEKVSAEEALKLALNLDERDINEVLNVVREANQAKGFVSFDELLGKEKVAAMLDNSAKGLLEQALQMWQKGDQAKGMEMVRKAASANPTHSYAMIMLGDLLRSSGQLDSAVRAYAQALDRNPKNQLALPRLGDLSYDLGNFSDAAKYYSDAIDMLDGRLERIDLLDRTAVALARNKKHSEAIALLDKWLKSNPNAPESFELSMRRAGILSDANRSDEAEKVLKGLIAQDEYNPAAYIALYTFLKERNNEKGARQVVNDGIVRITAASEQDRLEPSFYRDIARLYGVIGKGEDAQKALWMGGMRTVEKRYFSNALYADNAYDKAFDVLKTWVKDEPQNPEAILSFAWVAAKLERDLDLAFARVEALRLDAAEDMDLGPVYRSRSYLNFAMKKYDAVITDIKQFLSADSVPQAGFFHRLWGLSAQELGRKDEAAEHLKKALELDPSEHADLKARIDMLEAA